MDVHLNSFSEKYSYWLKRYCCVWRQKILINSMKCKSKIHFTTFPELNWTRSSSSFVSHCLPFLSSNFRSGTQGLKKRSTNPGSILSESWPTQFIVFCLTLMQTNTSNPFFQMHKIPKTQSLDSWTWNKSSTLWKNTKISKPLHR